MEGITQATGDVFTRLTQAAMKYYQNNMVAYQDWVETRLNRMMRFPQLQAQEKMAKELELFKSSIDKPLKQKPEPQWEKHA